MCNKVRLTIYLDENVNEKLREYISETYPGVFRGALSAEIQNAVAEYLSLRHAQIHTKPLNPGVPRIHRICTWIIKTLKELGFINQVGYKTLNKVISEIRGSDDRTIKKWIKILKKEGYIKLIGTYTYEIL